MRFERRCSTIIRSTEWSQTFDMPAFPTLKTGAIAQYPLTVGETFRTESIEFLDGTSQRYATGGAGRRAWSIQLTDLDPQESATVTTFLNKYGNGLFSFTDPASGDVIPRCTVAGGQLKHTITGEMSEMTSAVIEELP